MPIKPLKEFTPPTQSDLFNIFSNTLLDVGAKVGGVQEPTTNTPVKFNKPAYNPLAEAIVPNNNIPSGTFTVSPTNLRDTISGTGAREPVKPLKPKSIAQARESVDNSLMNNWNISRNRDTGEFVYNPTGESLADVLERMGPQPGQDADGGYRIPTTNRSARDVVTQSSTPEQFSGILPQVLASTPTRGSADERTKALHRSGVLNVGSTSDRSGLRNQLAYVLANLAAGINPQGPGATLGGATINMIRGEQYSDLLASALAGPDSATRGAPGVQTFALGPADIQGVQQAREQQERLAQSGEALDVQQGYLRLAEEQAANPQWELSQLDDGGSIFVDKKNPFNFIQMDDLKLKQNHDVRVINAGDKNIVFDATPGIPDSQRVIKEIKITPDEQALNAIASTVAPKLAAEASEQAVTDMAPIVFTLMQKQFANEKGEIEDDNIVVILEALKGGPTGTIAPSALTSAFRLFAGTAEGDKLQMQFNQYQVALISLLRQGYTRQEAAEMLRPQTTPASGKKPNPLVK